MSILFVPTNHGYIKHMLGPLERIVKKSCYIDKRASVAGLIAKNLILEKKACGSATWKSCTTSRVGVISSPIVSTGSRIT